MLCLVSFACIFYIGGGLVCWWFGNKGGGM